MARAGEDHRMTWRAVAVAVASVAVLLATAQPASAEKTCYWDTKTNRLRCTNAVPGGKPHDPGGGGGVGDNAPPGRWIIWQNDVAPEPDGYCPPDPDTGENVQSKYLQFIPAGNLEGTTTVARWCPPEETQKPPPPPSPAELRGLAVAPEPVININPVGRGLTGLPTYLWGEEPTPLVVGPLSLRGWMVTGRAEPTLWEWTLGEPGQDRNPDPYRSSTTPGSKESPAADYTYETKGSYTVTHTVTYDGSFTVNGPFGVSVSAGVGDISVTATRGYDVIEVRGSRD